MGRSSLEAMEGRSDSDREKGRHEGVILFAAFRLAYAVRMLSPAHQKRTESRAYHKRAKRTKWERAGDSFIAVSIASRLTKSCAAVASAETIVRLCQLACEIARCAPELRPLPATIRRTGAGCTLPGKM